ncbi:MAG TPA: lytic murein transglycosylase B [Burkholderiales bacterium]|nr:lytic murein transglycosylase B [Burkholderiales bacterium]
MKRFLLLAVAFLSASATAAPSVEPPYAARPEVQAFITAVSQKHNFDEVELQRLFSQARMHPGVIKAMTPLPQGKRSWKTYRGNFVNARRIEAGHRFMQIYAEALQRAEVQYGVPREIIAAIIGVETEYGRNMGTYRVIDALSTLSFDYPRRADYFRDELEEFLLLSRESKVDAAELQGSYAGALGIPQFMPSSIRRYGVDHDGDQLRDLRNPVDAIGSVANFLQKHGWVSGGPISVSAVAEGEAFRAFADGSVLPAHPVAELRRAGVKFDAGIANDMQSILIELDSADAPAEYRVAFQNFYVLTRYNRSSFYASAVTDLAEALKSQAN